MSVRRAPQALASQPVWVLEDARAGASEQAVAIAERLAVPFRRVPLAWNWAATVAGLAGARSGPHPPPFVSAQRAAPPALVISAGARAAAVALWLRQRFGCPAVHCAGPQPLRAWAPLLRRFDLLVAQENEAPPGSDVLPVRGVPNRVSPVLLAQARGTWAERLSHLPRPRVALLVGGPLDRWFRGADMRPALAHNLGRQVAGLAAEAGGCVLATTSRRTGAEATDALAAGLGRVLHLLYRWGEPGENPYAGYLATADAVVVTADSVSMLSEACATTSPVFAALPELAGNPGAIEPLFRAGQIRPFNGSLSPWPRTPLDEAGRAAAEILRRFGPLEPEPPPE